MSFARLVEQCHDAGLELCLELHKLKPEEHQRARDLQRPLQKLHHAWEIALVKAGIVASQSSDTTPPKAVTNELTPVIK